MMKDKFEELRKKVYPVEKMVWMVKNRTLGYIGYDFINTRQLTEEATKEVKEIFDEMVRIDNRKPKKIPPMPGFGTSAKVKLEICRIYLPRLKEIVLNEDNWI